MIYQGARTERAKRLYIFALCLAMITFVMQGMAMGVYAAAPVDAFTPIDPDDLTLLQQILNDFTGYYYYETLPAEASNALEAVKATTFTGHAEVAGALMLACAGIFIASESRTLLPRVMDLYFFVNSDLTEYEKNQIKKDIYKMERDGFLHMLGIDFKLRNGIFDLAQEIRTAIANEGKYTVEDITITDQHMINPAPGTYQTYIVAAPQGGITTWYFNGTQACPDIRHPPNGIASDTDGSYHDKLDLWRMHGYMGTTMMLDYYQTANDQVRDFWYWGQNVFGENSGGQPFSISVSDVGIYYNGELIFEADAYAYPMPVRFTGHSDIAIITNADSVDVTARMPAPIEFEEEEIEENEEYAEAIAPIITQRNMDINSPFSRAMVRIPETDYEDWTVPQNETSIEPDPDSVIVPIPESMPVPYTVPQPYPDGGLGDLPVTIPDEVDGSKIPKVRNYNEFKNRFPFSLPWDIQRIFSLFDYYTAEPPSFEVSLGDFIVDSSSQSSDQTYEINLDWMQDYIPFIHVMELIIADLILIMWILRHYVAG